MSQGYDGLIEMVFTIAVVLGLAFWQLWSLARERRRDEAARSVDRAARHPVGQHPPDDG